MIEFPQGCAEPWATCRHPLRGLGVTARTGGQRRDERQPRVLGLYITFCFEVFQNALTPGSNRNTVARY